jgi:hypothetical protein
MLMATRRRFLQTALTGSGAIFLAPFVRQLDAAPGPAGRPVRIVFVLQGNGVYPAQIQPEGIERPRNPSTIEDRPLAGHTLARSIDPLEPFKDRLTLLNGLSGKVARGSHSSDFGALGCYPQTKGPFAETIDAALAKHLGGIFPHVGLGVRTEGGQSIIYNVSAWEKSKALPTQCNPMMAYQRLFASAATGDARKQFDVKTNLLDFMADDVRRLQAGLNSQERAKLDHYLDAFESMSGRQSALVQESERIRAAAPKPDDRYLPEGKLFERLDAQFEVAAGALLGGLTNVITLSSGCGPGTVGVSPDGTEIGLEPGKIGSHSIGHGSSVQGQTAEELHIRIRRRHIESLARFLQKLESVPEGEGTFLDNTLVIFGSDSAEGHHPWCYEWPFLVIGDLGGRLKPGGRYLRFPWYGNPGHRTVANFYLTLLHAAGAPRDTFGLPDIALRDLDQSGPLAELLS